MRAWLFAVAAALALGAFAPMVASARDDSVEDDSVEAGSVEAGVLAQINWARTHPAQYARMLRRYRTYFQGRIVQEPDDNTPVMTREGRSAVDEAIAYVERQQPMAPVAEDGRLDQAAAGYVEETGPDGLVGHFGRGDETPRQRVEGAGVRAGSVGEVIAYGPVTPQAVVRQLIVDDGVPGRGHRSVIFDPGYRIAGAGCGAHRVYRTMCVVDFAGAVMGR